MSVRHPMCVLHPFLSKILFMIKWTYGFFHFLVTIYDETFYEKRNNHIFPITAFAQCSL